MKNNATLLGIDVNNNGARDNVERKVYATYKKAIERAKKEDRSLNCRRYLYLFRQQKRIPKMAQVITGWQINSEERIKNMDQDNLRGSFLKISHNNL